jgi:hypothetical protein
LSVGLSKVVGYELSQRASDHAAHTGKRKSVQKFNLETYREGITLEIGVCGLEDNIKIHLKKSMVLYCGLG